METTHAHVSHREAEIEDLSPAQVGTMVEEVGAAACAESKSVLEESLMEDILLLFCLGSSLRGTASPFSMLPADLLRDSVARAVREAAEDVMEARGLKTPPASPSLSPREPPPMSWHRVAAKSTKRMVQRPFKSAIVMRDTSRPGTQRNQSYPAFLAGARSSKLPQSPFVEDAKRPRSPHDAEEDHDRVLSMSSTPASSTKFQKRSAFAPTFCTPPSLWKDE
jgi:hypothetical protein